MGISDTIHFCAELKTFILKKNYKIKKIFKFISAVLIQSLSVNLTLLRSTPAHKDWKSLNESERHVMVNEIARLSVHGEDEFFFL